MKSPEIKLGKFGRPASMLKISAAVALCLLVFLTPTFAKTLVEYRENVAYVRLLTEEMLAYVEENLGDGRRDDEYEKELLTEIRQSLPPTEKILWEGATVETESRWLAEKLKAFEEQRDWQERRKTLGEINERLAAIENKMKELETAAASTRTKDEDKRKLAEILRREEFQKPEAQEESWFQRLQRRIREWLNEKFPRPDIPPGATDRFQSLSVFLQILLYVVILGLIGFLIYRFAPFLAQKFRRRENEDRDERVILGERLAAHENAQTLFGEAEALARAGDLRAAIRKGYIALLCELSDRKIIGLAQHKTNRDYLRDVRKRGELHRKMRGLTNNYERHWYGFDPAREEDWNEFKREYQKALNSESS